MYIRSMNNGPHFLAVEISSFNCLKKLEIYFHEICPKTGNDGCKAFLLCKSCFSRQISDETCDYNERKLFLQALDTRHLMCPACTSILHLQKFIETKFNLSSSNYRVRKPTHQSFFCVYQTKERVIDLFLPQIESPNPSHYTSLE